MKIFLASGFVLRPMKLRMNRFVETVANFPCTGASLGFLQNGCPIFLDRRLSPKKLYFATHIYHVFDIVDL